MKKKYMLLKKILFLSFFLFSFVSSSFSTTISNLELYNVNGSTSSSAATCSNNGTITVTATGSNINPSLYIFTITNGPTSNGQTYPFPNQFHESTFTFIDLYPGTYEVTVEDAGDPSNPSFTGSVTVLDETELLNFTTSSTAPSCPGESNGSISVNVLDGVGPYQYQIIDGPIGTTTVPISDSSANYTFNNLPSGDYRIRVFDVCGDFQTRNRRINTSSSPSVNLRGNGVNRISCTEAIYSVDVFGSGSYTYEIVGGAPSGYASSNTTGNFTLPINQAPYTFSVTGNCGQTDTYTYNNPTNGVSFFVLDKGCAGFDLSLNPRWMYGPYTYTLTNTPAGYTGPLTNTTGDFDDLPFGDYEYTVTDSCGSVFSGANNETFAAVEIDPSTDAEGDTCNVGLGSVVISYNSNDAPGPVSFELTTVPASFMGDPGPKNGNVFNELTVGNYVVTATDACGNTDTHAFEFEEADALDVTFDISVVQGCVNDHSVQVNTTTNTSGGFGFRRYRLRDVSTGIQRGSAAAFFGPATFSNVAPGEYYIEYDFFSGCGIDSEPFTVEAYEQPRLTPLSSYTCANNGLVTISGVTEGGVGPFSYSLINTANNQILATSTECYFNNQDAALAYTVRIEDNCGNSSSAQVSPVAVGLGLEFQGETCAPLGESFPFYLRAYNGVNYDWSFPDGSTFNGNDPRAIIGTVSNSDYGVYTIIASTNDGCRTQELSIDFESCPLPPVHLDFDGVDDYLSGDSILNGLNEVTLMAWVKIDPSNAGVSSVTIAGEDISCRIYVQNGNRFMFGTRTTAGSTRATNGVHVNYNEWHHITGVFNGVTGEQTIYIDGERSTSSINTSQIGQTILCTASWTGDFEIGRLSRNVSNQEYFNGEIDEVRVFNKALTETQIQRMVYQEIENNSGFVKGTVINKDIEDDVTGLKINWSTLLAYYPMTNIVNSATLDYSGNNRDVLLNNITTVQEQTAPMPYESVSDGNWTDESTWLHGDVWDIEDTATNKDWSIVHIKHDVNADHSVKNLGLFIDENKTLEVAPDNEVNNSWYLELNGTLNLLGDSQLVQGTSSDLVTSAQGNILRRQEGTASPFRYNYWSSPVGSPLETNVTTAFTDNEEGVNNPNNTSFMLNTIKDDRGTLFSFTNTYNEIGKISTYWLYTYQNGLSYWNWTALSPSTPLQPGIGYTQKGTGNGGAEQQYIFDGKPNNGTILVEVDDVGGPGSVSDVSRTGYLLGNPYPSAIDIHKFIDDNIGVIGDENSPSGGFVQIWQQWSGSSHVLTDYIGGYAKVNKTGSIRASQFIGLSGDNTGNREGTLAPTRYLPVGQGFVVEIVANNAQINFNNGQRIYRKEGDATIFLKSTTKKSPKLSASKQKEDENLMQKIRLEFNTVKGPETRQELLLGFSDFTTDGFDYGYDAKSTEESHDYLNLDFEGQNMHIQAYGTITKEKVVPFNFRSSGENTFEIKLTKLDNIPEDQAIYLRDNETDIYFDLTKNQEYNFTSKQGVFNNRFELVFQSKQEVLSTEEAIAIKNYVYFQNKTNTLFVKKLNSNVSKLSLINMRGQVVLEMADVTIEQLENGIVFNAISTGAYVVYIRTETNEVLNKKIIVN